MLSGACGAERGAKARARAHTCLSRGCVLGRAANHNLSTHVAGRKKAKRAPLDLDPACCMHRHIYPPFASRRPSLPRRHGGGQEILPRLPRPGASRRIDFQPPCHCLLCVSPGAPPTVLLSACVTTGRLYAPCRVDAQAGKQPAAAVARRPAQIRRRPGPCVAASLDAAPLCLSHQAPRS